MWREFGEFRNDRSGLAPPTREAFYSFAATHPAVVGAERTCSFLFFRAPGCVIGFLFPALPLLQTAARPREEEGLDRDEPIMQMLEEPAPQENAPANL